MMQRVQRAIGTFFFLTTCFLAPAEAMESEYRPYEPVVRVHPPPRYVPMGRTTPQVVPPEAMVVVASSKPALLACSTHQ